MARSDDEKPAKAASGTKGKRAPARKAAPRGKKSAEAAKAPAAKVPAAPKTPARRPPARAAKNAKPSASAANAKPAPKARKTAPKASASKPASTAKAPRKPATPRRRKPAEPTPAVPVPVTTLAELGEEERIEEAKYQPRERPPRAFEEERFLFPETYGENRVRLLVKDPEWLFAYWDVAPEALESLRREVGERTSALSRLTLRIRDPHHGGTSVILLPEGVQSWYVKADHAPRAYRAELGLTLPSGEFRPLAESNTVRTPWAGSSGERAVRRVRFDGAPASRAESAGTDASPAASVEEEPAGQAAAPGPWAPQPATQIGGQPVPEAPASSSAGESGPGGASDVYRR